MVRAGSNETGHSLGSFGSIKWPARIVEDRDAPDEISFKTPDGTPHRYPGYTGYTLRVVRLKGARGDYSVFCVTEATDASP